ncbi:MULTISPECIES: hypothetical protein [unclassified Rhizobium]|uniref:hypothetical protein n=1 Tax=unclassified Rhizobium TaxID=2613769 RepID=UPI00288AF3A0|nr:MULTISPECIES: hypothetical protein [unclassified Rhizobium]
MKTDSETLTARVAVPSSKTDSSAVQFEEIPLPPRELWEDGDTAAAIEPTPVAPTEEPAPAADVLDFVTSTHELSVPLKHAFRMDGKVVDKIVVKRLTLGQVDAFVRRAASASFSTFDIYAVMTGMPASVLRGLVDEDGDAVVDAAYDFLPRALKAESASPAT